MHMAEVLAMLQPCGARQGTGPRSRRRREAGFTLIEIFAVMALMAIGTAMVVMIAPGVIRLGKADSGSKQVAGILRKAREEAVAKRRNIEVSFDTTNNRIEIRRVEYNWAVNPPTAVEQLEQALPLEGGVQFLKFGAISPAAPISSFAPNTNVVTFPTLNAKPTVTFTPEGAATDPSSGDPLDGTIFLGRNNETTSARALTVLGVTANVERWQWNATAWVASK
jgi:type II secretory pathway pseudopilin PulG